MGYNSYACLIATRAASITWGCAGFLSITNDGPLFTQCNHVCLTVTLNVVTAFDGLDECFMVISNVLNDECYVNSDDPKGCDEIM